MQKILNWKFLCYFLNAYHQLVCIANFSFAYFPMFVPICVKVIVKCMTYDCVIDMRINMHIISVNQ